MELIDHYIMEIKTEMRKKGLQSDKLPELKDQLYSEFADFVEEHDDQSDVEVLERKFINLQESPTLLAVSLGTTDNSESLKYMLIRYSVVYLVLMTMFFYDIYLMGDNTQINNVYDTIGRILFLIWWLFPIVILINRFKIRKDYELIPNLELLIIDAFSIYGLLLALFMFYAFLEGPTQAKYFGGYLGEAVIGTLIFLFYLFNQRSKFINLKEKIFGKNPSKV